jgi:hypothetical protein
MVEYMLELEYVSKSYNITSKPKIIELNNCLEHPSSSTQHGQRKIYIGKLKSIKYKIFQHNKSMLHVNQLLSILLTFHVCV